MLRVCEETAAAALGGELVVAGAEFVEPAGEVPGVVKGVVAGVVAGVVTGVVAGVVGVVAGADELVLPVPGVLPEEAVPPVLLLPPEEVRQELETPA